MSRASSFLRIGALLALLLAAMPLAPVTASALDFGGFFRGKQLEAREMPVDGAEAVRILNAYRRSRGLGPVRVDPTLTRIAADHALRMARANKVDHVLRGEGSFAKRLRTGGFDAAVASENIGGGYDDLDEAFAGWRKSREHNRNLLKPDFTLIGIALAYAPASKYKTYWSLVLAAPYEGPPPGAASGPTAGPLIIR